MPDDALALLRAQLVPTSNGNSHEDVAKRFGLGKPRLTPEQWRRINTAVEAWKAQVLHSARLLPAHAYQRGRTQTVRFLRLLGTQEPVTPAVDRATIDWLNWTLEHELTGTLDRYIDSIRSAVLYGAENTQNPTAVASALYHATQAADRDWRLVAQTEMARANALGRLDGAHQMGYDEVWIPPHTGACEDCKRLIENKVFPIELLRDASNYGRKRSEWVPCLPLHPRCRHAAVAWVPAVYREAQEEYARMSELGLDDETLAAMFDSSGQLRPQYEGDPRLTALSKTAGTREADGSSLGPEHMVTGQGPYEFILGQVVRKVRSTGHVAKGFFDPPQAGLDPLIWEDDELKPSIREAILDFWTGVLGEDWQTWARVYITGSATSYQWGTGWKHPWLGSHQTPTYPDVDTHLVIDYQRVQTARPLWADLTPMELRKLLEAWVQKAKQDVEVAPGLRLDAYIRTEDRQGEFEADVRHTGQGVYDVLKDGWLIEPARAEDGEYLGQRLLGGIGGRLANENPDWIAYADTASTQLQASLDAYEREPGPDTLSALQVMMDELYADRKAAFLEGAGQEDRGNFVWAYLTNFGPLADAKELLHRAVSLP